MVALDIRNSRMKDFYDIWFMANTWEFEMKPVPEDIPFALTDGFLDDGQKKVQWTAFVNRLDAGEERPTLAEVGAVIRSFLLPCISKESEQESGTHWNPTHHWHCKGLSAREYCSKSPDPLWPIISDGSCYATIHLSLAER